MKVLFYGGCHAQVLQRIFEEFADGDHDYQLLINFKLIASGEPFPFEMIRDFDWVVFSPIVSRAGYATAELPEYCRSVGVRSLSYPWLHWSGYFPGISKGLSPLGVEEYFYPHLEVRAQRAGSLAGFKADVYEGFQAAAASDAPDGAEWVRERLIETTEFMARRERESAIDLPMSEFIRTNYQQVRLFLTPDHASIALYRVLAKRVAERLGVTLDRSLMYTAWEPQKEKQTPILPAVHHHLGLPFTGGDYVNNEIPGSPMNLSGYLARLYQSSSGVPFYTAMVKTFVKPGPDLKESYAADQLLRVKPGDVLSFEERDVDGEHIVGRTAILNGTPIPDKQPLFIFRHHWK